MWCRITLLCLLMIAGCSEQPLSEQHILPTGFSGIYKIVRSSNYHGGYRVDGNRVVFTIPEDGILQVGSKTLEDVCLSCNGLSAEFVDGQSIPLYSPSSAPSDLRDDIPMLLGILNSGNTIWYAIGNHEQLTELLAQIRSNKYQGLDEMLAFNHQ